MLPAVHCEIPQVLQSAPVNRPLHFIHLQLSSSSTPPLAQVISHGGVTGLPPESWHWHVSEFSRESDRRAQEAFDLLHVLQSMPVHEPVQPSHLPVTELYKPPCLHTGWGILSQKRPVKLPDWSRQLQDTLSTEQPLKQSVSFSVQMLQFTPLKKLGHVHSHVFGLTKPLLPQSR